MSGHSKNRSSPPDYCQKRRRETEWAHCSQQGERWGVREERNPLVNRIRVERGEGECNPEEGWFHCWLKWSSMLLIPETLLHYLCTVFPRLLWLKFIQRAGFCLEEIRKKVVLYRKTMRDNAAKVCSPIIPGALSFALCFFVFCSFRALEYSLFLGFDDILNNYEVNFA